MRILAAAALATVLLYVAISGSAQAAPSGQYTTYGEGSLSCGTWLAHRTGGEQYPYNAWVLGWVSAAGYYQVRGALRDTDSNALIAWVDKYCREHPLDPINKAANRVVESLFKPE
jgi:hypothetical protein